MHIPPPLLSNLATSLNAHSLPFLTISEITTLAKAKIKMRYKSKAKISLSLSKKHNNGIETNYSETAATVIS